MKKKYKFAVNAVDVVIFTAKDNGFQVLLIKMRKKPYLKHWAAPGGLIRPKESLDNAAKRILLEKARIKHAYLEQLYTFGKVGRDPFGRVVSTAYLALVPSEKIKPRTAKEYGNINWFSINELPKLAYDHKEIIKTATKRLRAKLGYTNIACNLLSQKFTLGQLQKTYEIILGKKLDKRNFRKKILSLKLIKKTKSKQSRVTNRPASLYKFASRKLKIINIL